MPALVRFQPPLLFAVCCLLSTLCYLLPVAFMPALACYQRPLRSALSYFPEFEIVGSKGSDPRWEFLSPFTSQIRLP
jgi:hypothetical protein